MNFSIKNITYFLIIAMIMTTTVSCGDKAHKEGDGHNHGPESTKQDGNGDSHEEEDENVAMLTAEQIKTAGIILGKVEQKQLAGAIKANGFLRVPNNNKANATSLFGGMVKDIAVEIGSTVKKGQVIATISNPQFIQFQEEYLTIDSRIVFAEQEMERQQILQEGNVGARKNLQNATAELNALRTRKASLRQQIQMMGINVAAISNNNLKSSLVVTSPMSGVVSNVFAKIGSYVDVSSPVVEIIENNALHLDLQVFEKDVPLIKVGQKIEFNVTNNPDKYYSAEVFNIGSSFSGESKTIAVHCKVTGNRNGLIDGMNITGMISMNGVLSPAVPNDAIVNAEGKYYIFIVKEKEEEPHVHKEGEEHDHDHDHANAGIIQFEKIEVMKGTTEMGYTGITSVTAIPENAHIVTKGAFFVNATLSSAGHDHAH